MSGLVQKCSRFTSAQVKSSKSEVRGAIERQLILALAATAGMMMATTATAAPSAVAQSSGAQNVGRSTGEVMQPSTCAADVQGLMCNLDNRALENAVPGQASQTTSAVSLTQPLSNAQMDRLADLLLGLIYFVLPIGFGVGLFLHDRQQAQRMATLEAQIKLLERLWNQTPQA